MDIALCLMMKNEMPRIPRLMKSIAEANICERVIVLDTGSTDGGPEWFEQHDKTEVHRMEWDGFGPCRSALMKHGYQKADWLLCLDADDVIELPCGPASFLSWLAEQKNPAIGVASIYPSMKFYLPRLVSGRTSEPWRFVGRAHEYMAGTGDALQTQQIHIIHKGDGADSSCRLQRNLELLLKDAAEDHRNSRTAFYLGNTYAELGKLKDAVKWYDKRLMLGGWDEETYCTMLYRGRCLGSIKDLLMAWKFRPTRAEAIYAAAQLCLRQGLDKQSQEYSRLAAQIPRPEDRLFVETSCYSC